MSRIIRRGFKLSFPIFLGVLFLLPGISSNPIQAATTKSKVADTGKKTGFNGDPSRKRGLELGFDYGQKAGKEDKDQNKQPNPGGQEAFQNPEKYYRYEYGSRASFCAGFKSGFVGGYQTAFGKKVPVRMSEGTTGSTTSLKPNSLKPKTPKTAPSGGTTSVSSSPSDAL